MNNIEAQPLVSVIIAFLNEEVFLAEAIQSVVDQEYINWELILVDDGSTDNSTSIAKKYVSNFQHRIIYAEHVEHSNKGLSASRNLGISLAKGDLVAFLDADDLWKQNKLVVQVAIMHKNSTASMLCEASEYWYDWNDKEKENKIIKVCKFQDQLFEPPSLLENLYPLSNGDAPCPSGIIVKRNILNKYGGFEEHFTGSYQLYEDQAFLHKIYLNEPVYISSLCHNRYRQREGSIVQKVTKQGNYRTVRQYFLNWLEKYIEENQTQSKKILKLLNRAQEEYRNPFIYKLRRKFQRLKAHLNRLCVL